MSKRKKKHIVIIDEDLFVAAVKAPLGGRAKSFLFAFLRQSNGFEKDFDKKSWKRYTDITGIGKTHLSNFKSELIRKGYMYEKANFLYLEKDLSKWGKLPNPVTSEKVTETGNESYRIREHKVTESGKHILISHLNTQLNKNTAFQAKGKNRERFEEKKKSLEEIRIEKYKNISTETLKEKIEIALDERDYREAGQIGEEVKRREKENRKKFLT